MVTRSFATSIQVAEQDEENAQSSTEDQAAQSRTEALKKLKKRAKTFSDSVILSLVSLLVTIFVQYYLLINSKSSRDSKPLLNSKPSIDSKPPLNSKSSSSLEITLLKTCVLSALVTCAFAVFFTIVAGLIADDDNPNKYLNLAFKLLLHVCGFLLKLTAFWLLLLIDESGAKAAMASVVLIAAALHVVLYNKTRRSNYRCDAVRYVRYAEELDHHIDLSKEMVNLAYGGFVGRVFDYFKNSTSTKDVCRDHMKVFDVLMFFTAVIAALALTLDVLPPLQEDWRRLIKVLEWLNIASVLTAVAAALSLSFGVVGEYAFLVVVPPLALVVWWLQATETGSRGPQAGQVLLVSVPTAVPFMAFRGLGRGPQAGQVLPVSVPIAVPFMAFGVLFAVILNSNSTPNTGDAVDLTKISICVFLVVFIMGLGWRLLEHRALRDPNLARGQNWARAMRYMLRCTYMTIMIALVLFGTLMLKTIWNFA